MNDFLTARLETIQDFFATQKLPTEFWRSLFSWDYWTDWPLPANSPYTASIIGLVVIVIFLLIIWRHRLQKLQLLAPVYDRPIQQLPSIIIFLVIMSISYLFFRSQEITYLSSRLVILATILVTLFWLGYLLFDLKCRAPNEARRYLEKERFFRYLPKKRKG